MGTGTQFIRVEEQTPTLCYALAALRHLAVTRVLSLWVLGFSGRGVWTSASACALRLPSIAVQGFHMYLGILDPQILMSGSAGIGCEDVSK